MNPGEHPDLGLDAARRMLGIRRVTGHNDGGTRTVMTVREHLLVTDEPEGNAGPTPLETVLGALVGCEGVMIQRCAKALEFRYRAVAMDAEGEVDQRGSRGVQGVRPYFNWVRLHVTVYSGESAARFDELTRSVEYRCPVINLFRAADVDVQVRWELAPADGEPR